MKRAPKALSNTGIHLWQSILLAILVVARAGERLLSLPLLPSSVRSVDLARKEARRLLPSNGIRLNLPDEVRLLSCVPTIVRWKMLVATVPIGTNCGGCDDVDGADFLVATGVVLAVADFVVLLAAAAVDGDDDPVGPNLHDAVPPRQPPIAGRRSSAARKARPPGTGLE